MAWLASLDARAARWLLPIRYLYLTFKYLLIALGAAMCLGLARQEFSEGRIGLGTGVLCATTFGVIKGLLTAWRAR